ncbi:MAG: DUF5522 domain-containing protein [Acidobacteriota bacterium]
MVVSLARPVPRRLLAPHPNRLSPQNPHYAEILAAHGEAVRQGRTTYIDPVSGLHVMTAFALWQRNCCEQGCRHCPWLPREADAAPEPESGDDG